MSKATNKQIAKTFRKALPFLWDGTRAGQGYHQSEYICHAINEGNDAWWCASADRSFAVEAATQIIEDRLRIDGGPTKTFGSWLRAKGVKRKVMTDPLVQAHRKAWLLQLIEEFSNKR